MLRHTITIRRRSEFRDAACRSFVRLRPTSRRGHLYAFPVTVVRDERIVGVSGGESRCVIGIFATCLILVAAVPHVIGVDLFERGRHVVRAVMRIGECLIDERVDVGAALSHKDEFVVERYGSLSVEELRIGFKRIEKAAT